MKLGFQFGGWLLAVASCAGLSATCYAQRPRFVAQHQQEKKQPPPPKQNQPKPNANRPPANQNRPAGRPPVQNPNARPNGNNAGGNNPRKDERLAPRQQLGVGAPRPWVDKMRDMKPQDRERVMQNSPAFRNMPSEQQNRIRDQFGQWDRKTPQQQVCLLYTSPSPRDS